MPFKYIFDLNFFDLGRSTFWSKQFKLIWINQKIPRFLRARPTSLSPGPAHVPLFFSSPSHCWPGPTRQGVLTSPVRAIARVVTATRYLLPLFISTCLWPLWFSQQPVGAPPVIASHRHWLHHWWTSPPQALLRPTDAGGPRWATLSCMLGVGCLWPCWWVSFAEL
jgi:hypothetical protein